MAGENLETLSPDGSISAITMPQALVTIDGKQVDCANNSQYIFLEQDLKPYTILRRLNG
jgi:hypothetical protein